MKLRSTAIGLASLLLVLGVPTAALETVIIRSCYDGDTCTTNAGEKVRLACIDTPEMGGKRAQPQRARQACDGCEVWWSAKASVCSGSAQTVTEERLESCSSRA